MIFFTQRQHYFLKETKRNPFLCLVMHGRIFELFSFAMSSMTTVHSLALLDRLFIVVYIINLKQTRCH